MAHARARAHYLDVVGLGTAGVAQAVLEHPVFSLNL
jgi:hypothetical protein